MNWMIGQGATRLPLLYAGFQLPGKNFVELGGRFKIETKPTVPQTDTGEQVGYTKALERTMLKELGKMAP